MASRTARRPDPVDLHVGQRIRARRRTLGLSQTALGKAVGVSFKQIQKYESGTNRIGAGRLYEISLALKMEIEALFEGAPLSSSKARRGSALQAITDGGIDRESERLIAAYYTIGDRQMRQHFLNLLRTISESYRPSGRP